MNTEHSIYIHVPFCVHRCAYCDFNTYAGQENNIPAYVAALAKEIAAIADCAGPDNPIEVHTLFFGGGTPSLLSEFHFDCLMRTMRAAFNFKEDIETTIEANPGTISREKLYGIRRIGINRISFGVQSSNTEELHMLERQHDFLDVIGVVADARKSGFDNLNLDLIYGLPGQSLQSWQTTVKRSLDLMPEHISAYALTLEHGTPFGRWSSKGLIPFPDPDLSADMYEWTQEFLAACGYAHYEISNWSKPGRECRHNLQYWRSLPYLGIGAGAHGYSLGIRYSNVLRIQTYIDRLAHPHPSQTFPLSPAAVNHRKQSPAEDMSDYMINKLRLVGEGVLAADFQERFGVDLMDVYCEAVEELIGSGLLEKKASGKSETFRLTDRGRLLGNRVFMRFV